MCLDQIRNKSEVGTINLIHQLYFKYNTKIIMQTSLTHIDKSVHIWHIGSFWQVCFTFFGLKRQEQRYLKSDSTLKVQKMAKIRNRYNQAPHLTKDTNGKVTTPQKDITNESQEVSPFQAGDHKASTNRRA